MGILLFILSSILSVIFLPIGFVYTTIKLLYKAKFKIWFYRMSDYCLIIAIGIDQLGNIVMQDLFNRLLIKSYGYKFGNPDLTISSILSKNEQNGTLSKFGMFIVCMLNTIDPGHTKNVIE